MRSLTAGAATSPPTLVPVSQFSSVQSLSRVRLCDPMNRSTPGLTVHHQLPEFTQTHVHRVSDAIQPSHALSSPSRVRSLTDNKTNIAVRITGSDVSGFLQGNGKSNASIGFFNDTLFVGRKGLKIITSNISGVLPSGIYIGDMIDEKNVNVLRPTDISRVMVLQYNDQGSYK